MSVTIYHNPACWHFAQYAGDDPAKAARSPEVIEYVQAPARRPRPADRIDQGDGHLPPRELLREKGHGPIAELGLSDPKWERRRTDSISCSRIRS